MHEYNDICYRYHAAKYADYSPVCPEHGGSNIDTDDTVPEYDKLGNEDNILKGYEIGADEYMVKPFSPKVLYAKCLALLSRTEAELTREVVIECGDIRLYPLRMDVEAGGNEVKLAPKEYFLLKVLMENKGIVLDRNRILDMVWGVGFDGTDRVVDSQIKKLRKSLGSYGGAIKTVIGGGYKIS